MTADKKQVGARLRQAREEPHRSDGRPRYSREKWAVLMSGAVRPGEDALPGVKSLADMIRQWERGDHSPGERYQVLYCRVTGRSRSELFGETLPPSPQVSPAIPTGTVEQGPELDQGDDEVKRRAAIQLIAALGVGAAVPPGVLEEVLAGIDHTLSHTTDLGEWEQVVHDYGHQLYRLPFETLVPALTADIVAVGELLKTGRSAHEQAGLLRVSAGLSGVLAEVLANLGDDRAARRTYATARRAADASGDRALRVWVRGRAAQHAGWASGAHHSVMTMVDEAVQIADGTPVSGLARAYAAGAYMAASQGDHQTAGDNLDMLKRTFDRLPHNPGAPTVLDFQEGQLRWNEAYVRTTSGDRRADDAIEDAYALYPPSALAPITNLHLMRAVSLVNGNEVNEGLGLALTSLNDRPRPVLATRQLVGQILRELPTAARTLPAALDLRALTAGT